MPDPVYLSALVHGHVQGVYYRAFTSRVARSLSISGYVKNIEDTGDVVIEAEGEKDNLEQFIEQLKIGPNDAIVENISVKWMDYKGLYSRFDVKY
jgi:acylphosphatase